MKTKCVLDASALLALIQDEPGANVIKPLLKNAVMSTINVVECLTVLQRFEMLPSEGYCLIQEIIQKIVSFEPYHIQKCAELQSVTKSKGLSLGDRACITLGLHLNLPIYTADKIWSELTVEGADIHIIR